MFEQDPELASAWRERQEQLLELQELYRLRLDRALDAARELLVRRVGNPMLLAHRRAAIRALRTLDRQHLVHLRRVHAEFEQRCSARETWNGDGTSSVGAATSAEPEGRR